MDNSFNISTSLYRKNIAYISKVAIISLIITYLFFMYHITLSIVYILVATLVIIITLLIFNLHFGFLLYISLIPNISMLKTSENSIAFLTIILLLLLIKSIFYSNLKFNIYLTIIGFFYFTLSIVSSALEGESLVSVTQDVRVVFTFILLYSIFSIYKNDSENTLKLTIICFVYGTLNAAILGILSLNLFSDNVYSRLIPLKGDPNYLAVCIALSILIVHIVNLNSKDNKISAFLLQLILLFFGLLTFSRGFLICLIPIVLIYFINRKKKSLKGILETLIIIALGLIGLRNQIQHIFLEFSNRFTVEEYGGGSGRIEIWSYYVTHYFSDIKYILIGMGNQFIVVPGFGEKAQHNIVLEILTSKGLLGSTLIISMYIILYKQMKNNLNIGKMIFANYIPFISVFFGYFFLNGAVSDIGVITLNLSIYLSILYRKQLFDLR